MYMNIFAKKKVDLCFKTNYNIVHGVETDSTGQGGFFVQGRGQRGSVKTLKQFNCQR